MKKIDFISFNNAYIDYCNIEVALLKKINNIFKILCEHIELSDHGIFKGDIISIYFDNEDYEITVYLNKEKHSNSDEIYIYCNNCFQYYCNVLKIRIKLLIF